MASLVTDSQICQEIAPKTEIRALSNPLNATIQLRFVCVYSLQKPPILFYGKVFCVPQIDGTFCLGYRFDG